MCIRCARNSGNTIEKIKKIKKSLNMNFFETLQTLEIENKIRNRTESESIPAILVVIWRSEENKILS
jgi:hypothetical protein